MPGSWCGGVSSELLERHTRHPHKSWGSGSPQGEVGTRHTFSDLDAGARGWLLGAQTDQPEDRALVLRPSYVRVHVRRPGKSQGRLTKVIFK